VAVLAALNLANRLTTEPTPRPATPDEAPRIEALIRLVEGAVHDREPAAS
jgi:hypothetical protein